MNTQRPRIVVLDDYERALRHLADWSEIDGVPTWTSTTIHYAWILGEPMVRPLKID